MGYLLVNGVNFNVEVTGDGAPVIWGHGLMGSIASENLLEFFDWDLFPKDKMLIRYDARGHGNSDASFSPVDYHWNNLADDMLSILEHLATDKSIVGGQSMGCATAIYAALKSPHKVKALVLMNPPTAWEMREPQWELYRQFSRMGFVLGGGLLAKIMSNRLDRFLPPWFIEENGSNALGVLEGVKPLKRMTLLNLFKGAGLTDLPSPESISSITVPTLVLGWKDDPSHPLDVAESLCESIPNAELVVAENYLDAAHWPKLIREFVAQHG